MEVDVTLLGWGCVGSSQIQHPEVWLVYQWNSESKRKPWFKIWTGLVGPDCTILQLPPLDPAPMRMLSVL